MRELRSGPRREACQARSGVVASLQGFRFSAAVRVRFAETDAQGIAHNSNYLVWFEVARVEHLEQTAGGYQRLREDGVEAVVLETHIRYLQPARFDDRLVVHVRCAELKGARFRYEYAVERDGSLIADGWTAHATVDAGTFRPTRVPAWLREAMLTGESSSLLSSPSSSSSPAPSSPPPSSAASSARPG